MDAVKLSVEALEKTDADFSYGDCEMLRDDKKVLFEGKIEEFLCHMPVPHPTMFVKSKILRKEEGFNEKYGLPADYELLIRLILKDYSNIHVNDKLVKFRVGGATNNVDFSDDIANIFIDRYSEFYNFKNKQIAKDLCYKREIPFGFSGSFEKYHKDKQFKNINIDKVNKFLSEQNIKLSKKEKVISKDIYKNNIKDVLHYGEKTKKPKVSVVIVAWHERDDLMRNIEHFQNQTEKNFELIIVDNGLDNDIKEKLKEYSLTHIILSENLGPSAGRNIGACYANSDILAFIDADGYVNKCYIESAIEIMKDNIKVAVRGKVLPINCSTKMPPILYDLGNKQFSIVPTTEGNLVMRKNDFLKVGGQEEVLFGHEGMVLFYRMIKYYDYSAKSFYYDPRLILYHDFEKSGKDVNRKKDERHDKFYDIINKNYLDFKEFAYNNVTLRIARIKYVDKNKEKDNAVENIKKSKSFQLGDLFFRSVKEPYKLLTYPYNFIKILLK
jgi:glycosyltransferase involved in cell wall biosynthesis